MSSQGLMRLFAARGAQLVVVALIVALGLDSALILSRALAGDTLSTPAEGAAHTLPFGPHSKNPQLVLAAVIDAHLFGAAPTAGGADAPPTTMALVLTGVIAVKGHPTAGQAIMGANAADTKVYAVGASIPGGAHLHAVYDDRVLLERNGALETLMLPRTALTGVTYSPVVAGRADLVHASPDVLAGLLRVQPVFSQGKLSGYRIFPGGPRGNQAFMQMGLRPGDLITAINGTTLDDPGRALEILQTLSSAGSASITVTRNGTQLEVNLNLASLPPDQTGAAAAPAEPPSALPASPAAPPMRRGPFGPRAQ
ncbi:MAG TPA: type II secretion system protein GspC [Steroidobacteraceae bacterium]|jgi:general secretion pathway protein C|nr:type II secretion system protein GspC [Steroidobacteraceae bacterium]